MGLTIALLGPPRITHEGEPLRVDTRKATALLAYLAVTGEPHRRDTLATLFWPESDQASARAALRRTLSNLHKGLGRTWLNAEREIVSLHDSDALVLDIRQYEACLSACQAHGHAGTAVCAACLPLLTEATTLYHGDFMTGFTLRDSPAFDEWQRWQAERLRRELAGALERLVAGKSALGQFATALTQARRWLALDPLHEPAHRWLMQLYSWAGQRTAALRQYHDCVRILDRELGVAPLAATTDLYHAIERDRGPRPPEALPAGPPPAASPADQAVAVTVTTAAIVRRALPPTPGPSAARARPYPLVGRGAEVTALRQAYDAIAADGRVVAITGEAGIGKTRLAEDFLAEAQAQGAATLAVRCYEGEASLAFSPVSAGLGTAIGRLDRTGQLATLSPRWLSEAARLAPELATLRPDLPAPPPLDSPGAQGRFFEGVSQVLLAAGEGLRPGILFLDDLHWADAASLDLLAYLVRRLPGHRCCILASWRDERTPGSARLDRLLAEQRRAGVVTHLPLSRLSRAAVQAFVRAARPAGDDLPATVGDRVYAETEGLPYFLVEYLAALAPDASGTATATTPPLSLPGGVRDLLRARLATASETGRQLLTTAAAIGRSFPFATLREASGRGEEEVLTALDELVAGGLIRELRGDTGEPAYDFSHDRLRLLVYDETSLARRRLLHRRIATALSDGGGVGGRREADRGALAGQIAQHYRLAGEDADAAHFFARAGDYARRLYANAEALAHYAAALALGHPDPAALHEASGDLQTLAGQYGAALTAYETAATLAGSPSLARIEHKLGSVHHRRGDWEEAERHFAAADLALTADAPASERARLAADWSLTAHHRGHTDRAVALARQALALAEAGGDAHALVQAHNLLGILAGARDDRAGARQHLEASATLAEDLGEPGARAAALNNLALLYGADGDTARAIATARTALDLCIAQGDRHREAALHNNLADLLHAAGRAAEALAHLKEAVTIYAEIGVEAGALRPQIWKLTAW